MNEQNAAEVSEFETEETETCKECNTPMEMLCSDEGGCVTFWCPECGTILQVLDGDEQGEWKSPRT